MKKAYLIDSTNEEITEVEYSDWEDVAPLIGCRWFDASYLESGESIYVDDEGLLSITPETKFFYPKGHHQPLAGNGLYVGPVDDEGDTLNPETPIDEVRKQIQFMDLFEVQLGTRQGRF